MIESFEYGQSIPPAILATAKGYFDQLVWMVPAWCKRVLISWSSEPEGEAVLTCEVLYEYRQAKITIYPSWMDSAEDIQRDNVIHELLHIYLNPAFDYANNTLAMLIEDEVFRVHAQAGLERLYEGAVQDMADTLFARLYVKEKETTRQTIAGTDRRRVVETGNTNGSRLRKG